MPCGLLGRPEVFGNLLSLRIGLGVTKLPPQRVFVLAIPKQRLKILNGVWIAHANQFLVQPRGTTQQERGFAFTKPRRLDWEEQADVAIDSFQRNGFFVMVNGRQVLDLDAVLELTDTLDVGFVKLRQLVGG